MIPIKKKNSRSESKKGRPDVLASPFVKWAGGKGQLLSQYEALFPKEYNNYIEPMVGGGAVFFHLYNQGKIHKKAILNDSNEELMNCYRVIKENIEALIRELKKHEPHKTDKNYYYEIRAWDRDPDFKKKEKSD